jgi:hypothetical protein
LTVAHAVIAIAVMTINPLPAKDRQFFIIAPVVQIKNSLPDIGNIVDLPEGYA